MEKRPETISDNRESLNIVAEIVLEKKQEHYVFALQNTESGWKIQRVSNPAFFIPPDAFGADFRF